jgi:hypothetical protein
LNLRQGLAHVLKIQFFEPLRAGQLDVGVEEEDVPLAGRRQGLLGRFAGDHRQIRRGVVL